MLDFIEALKVYCESPLKYFERDLYRSRTKVVKGTGSCWGLLNQIDEMEKKSPDDVSDTVAEVPFMSE